jgi:hypothetical protein
MSYIMLYVGKEHIINHCHHVDIYNPKSGAQKVEVYNLSGWPD